MLKNKKGVALFLVMTLVLLNTYYASAGPVTSTSGPTIDVTSDGAMTTSEQSLSVELKGTVFSDLPAPIISVIMPTQVYFGLAPNDTAVNKVLSPIIPITNSGDIDVNISITRATITGAGTTLTPGTPTGNQVRLGVAPVDMVSATAFPVNANSYLLRSNLSDSYYVNLGTIGSGPADSVKKFKVFGDAEDGIQWTDDDTFTVKTVFKASL